MKNTFTYCSFYWKTKFNEKIFKKRWRYYYIKDKDGKTPILLVYEITGADSRVMIILLSAKPNKSCFQNIFRISNSNIRNKKDDTKTIITRSMYLFASIICWLLVFFLQLDYLPYNAQFFYNNFFYF